MKKQLLTTIIIYIISTINTQAGNKIKIFQKQDTILGSTSLKKEKSILSNNSIEANSKNYDINNIDSFIINDKDFYQIINYKNQLKIARILFIGEISGYKIRDNEKEILLIKDIKSEDYIVTTGNNIRGVYNYLFKDCIVKDSSLIKNQRQKVDDISLIKEVTKSYNCNNKDYKIYKFKKPLSAYIGALGGLIIYKPIFKGINTYVLNSAKTTADISYSFGGNLIMDVDNRYQIELQIAYLEAKSTLKNSFDYTSPVKYSNIYEGTITMKAVDINFLFKYRILQKKLSPTLNAGVCFNTKIKNAADFYRYSSLSPTPSPIQHVELTYSSGGLNLGVGINYKPINRINLFLDTGVKLLFGVGEAASRRSTEMIFYTSLGFGIKLNK